MRFGSVLCCGLILCVCVGCRDFDVLGMVRSSDADARFEESHDADPVEPPSVADPNRFSFLVLADTHIHDGVPNVFSVVEEHRDEWGVEFVVVLGDVTESGRPTQYELVMSDREAYSGEVYFIPGNHDLYHGGAAWYLSYLGPTSYSFAVGDCTLLMLDTANGSLGALQTHWLEDQLDHAGDGTILVFSHYSLFDRVWETNTVWTSNEEKYHLISLFDSYDVSVVFSGHLHRYEESEVRGVRYVIVDDFRDPSDHSMIKVAVAPEGVSLEAMEP